MSKIDLDTISTGYNLTKINSNFQKIEDEFNNKVFYKDPPVSEPNFMLDTLDMNSNRIINLPAPINPSEAVRLQDVQGLVSGIPSASLVPFTPYIDVSSINVQGAIQELVDDRGSGQYNPTTTGITNIVSIAAFTANWMRVKNIVTVFGVVDSVVGTGGLSSSLELSLPIPANLSTISLSGTFGGIIGNTMSMGFIRGNPATSRAVFTFSPSTAANTSYCYSYSYVVQ